MARWMPREERKRRNAMIVSLYRDHNMPTRHICERFGITHGAVSLVLRNAGITLDGRRSYAGLGIAYHNRKVSFVA